jgi:hypothetical protein
MSRYFRKDPRTMLLTHPRTGTMWATERVVAMYRHYQQEQGDGISREERHLRYLWSAYHSGFHPHLGPQGSETVVPELTERLFCLLRDARQVMVSFWFYLRAQPPDERLGPIPDDLETYVKRYGVRRYLQYLARVGSLLEDGTAQGVVFYDDIGSEEFLAETVPLMLGIDWKPSTAVIAEVQRNTRDKRVNDFGTDHSMASPKLLDWIQSKVAKRCRLEPYRLRYIECLPG